MALTNAHKALRQKVWTPAERWRQRVGLIRPRPKGRFGWCSICGLICYSKHASRPVESHGRCRYPDEIIGLPLKRAGRPRRTREQLADSFEAAVRYLLKGEVLGDFDTGDETGTGLALRFQLRDASLRERIRDLVNALPADQRGAKQLPFWKTALEWGAEQRGFKL
jgi:hypothetical protein